MSYYFRL